MHIPTPLNVVDLVRHRLDFADKVKALDPCCGNGTSLHALCADEDVETFGVELEIARAAAAKDRLNRVVLGAMQDSRVSGRAFGLIFLNPPYDDGVEGRLEAEFLRRATDWLVPGGVLVYIVKESMYNNPEVRRILLRRYEAWEHWRFPEEEYGDYGQTVMICRRRVTNPSMILVEELPLKDLQHTPPDAPRFTVPGTPAISTFFSARIDPGTLEQLMAQSKLWRDFGAKKAHLLTSQRPPQPLKIGHMSLMLAAGAINGVYGGSDGIPLHLSRGMVKRVELKKVETYMEQGEPVAKHITTHAFEVVVRAMTGNGTIMNIAEAGKGSANGEVIVEHLSSENEEADDAD